MTGCPHIDLTSPDTFQGDLPREVFKYLRVNEPVYWHEDPVQREKWREAIRKEFRDMIKRGVWRNKRRRDVPEGRRCVKCKWVFDIKRDGRFRPRLVACGYSQVAGVDFTANFAPVINDVTWRILMVTMIVMNLEGKIIDVETAFLHGDLEEEIYMDCPEGLAEATGLHDAQHRI